MSRKLARILKTDVMADIPLAALAQIVRFGGRGKDTVLAHITPKEAKKLKEMGGSGEINPNTGLPEFQEDFGDFGYTAEDVQASAPDVYSEMYPGGELPSAGMETVYEPSGESYYQPEGFGDYGYAPITLAQAPAVSAAPAAAAGPPARAFDPEKYIEEQAGPTEPEPSFWDKISGYATPENLARLGIVAGGGAAGLVQGARARRQAQRAEQELRAQAAPYQQEGQRLMAQAQRGELAPAAQQRFAAAQAQLAQRAQRLGGVGTQQAQIRLDEMRQRLIESQFDYGMKVAGIGDQIVRGAIQAGLSADQQVAEQQNRFFMNMAAAVGGIKKAK